MRRIAMVLLLGSTLLARPAAAYADEITEHPECQQLWYQLAGPVVARMLWYVQAADQYPLLPNGRPPVSPYPYLAYPWAPAIFHGPGGPGWTFASLYALRGIQQYPLNAAVFGPFGGAPAPGGVPLAVPFVANQVVAAAGGLVGVAPGDLIGLADLRQAQVGNILAAIDTRQGIIGNRLAAAEFNLNYAAYPLAQAVNYREVLEGLDFWVRNACPRAVPERNGGGESSTERP